MTTNSKSHNRVAPRYHADASKPLAATITVGVSLDASEQILECHIEDISLQGCAVRVSNALPQGTKLGIIRLAHVDSDHEFIAAGRICWERQTGLTAMTYGFKFRREVKAECFSNFKNAELISQRDEKRERVGLSASVRQQSPQLSLKDATLIDVSASGLQLRTEVPLTVGGLILVVLENGERCMAEVIWSSDMESTCLAGAKFTRPDEGCNFHRKITSVLT